MALHAFLILCSAAIIYCYRSPKTDRDVFMIAANIVLIGVNVYSMLVQLTQSLS